MTYPTRRFLAGAWALRALRPLLALLPALAVLAARADGPAKTFDIAAGSAEVTLEQFTAQAGVQLAYAPDQVRGVQTHAVHGDYAPLDALQQMVAGTPLVVVQDRTPGAFAVRRAAPAAKNASSPPPASEAAGDEDQGSNARSVVALNPFTVESTPDRGYSAINSNSITAFNVDLDHVPVTADIIDSTFLKDVGSPLTLEGALQDFDAGAAFSAGNVTNAAQNQPGDRVAAPTLKVRGANTNGIQINGIQLNAGNYGNTNFGSTSLFGVDRIEVIDGAQSLLFGGGGAGAVVNVTTNPALFERPAFGSLSYMIDEYGTKNATFDFGLGLKNLAVRFTAVQNSTDTRRVGIGDRLEGQYLQLAAHVFNTTVKVTLQQTLDNRVSPDYLSLSSSGDPNFSKYNNNHLEYLLATNQAGGILNGNLNWTNVESLLGQQNTDSDVSEMGIFEADSTWTKWLSTQLTIGAANLDADQGGAGSVSFYSPGATANPLPGNWTMSEPQSGYPMEDDWRAHVAKAIRFTALLTNHFFNDTATSRTSFDADYTGDKLDIFGYGYFQADSSWNILHNNPTSTSTYGRTVVPTQSWTVNNGPVFYDLTNPLYGAVNAASSRITLNGVNYVRALVTPVIDGLPGPGTNCSDGYAVVNYTQWLNGKLDTMAGARMTTMWVTTPGTFYFKLHDAISYSTGIDYHVLPWLVPYVDWSSIWGSQSAGTQEPNGSVEPPEHDVGEEVGIKFDPSDTRISGSISAYTSSNHDQSSSVPNVSGAVSPSGLNGQIPGGTGNNQPANILTYGLAAQLTANPTPNWRMRLSAQWNGGEYKSSVSYPQNYNDQFYENSSGDVTYADGTVVYVPATFSKTKLTVPAGTAGAVPLTVNLLSTPGSQYYANPAVVTGAINKTSNGGLVLLSPADPVHGSILTGKTGLPMTDYQLNTALTGIVPFGFINAVNSGSQTASYPAYAAVFTSVYTFSRGWLKGFDIGGTASGQWRWLALNYNPGTSQLPPSAQQQFYLPPIIRFDLITGYTHKFRRVTWHTQLNVDNIFNQYKVVVFPTTTTGFTSISSLTANLTQPPRYFAWTNTISF